MESVIQHSVEALSLGALYALYALPVALVFGVMRLINFAHGELVMVGAFVYFYFASVPSIPLIGLAIVIVTAVAILMERTAFRPVRGASPATLLVTSFALSAMLQALATMFFGSQTKTLTVGASLGGSVNIAGIQTTVLDLITIGAVALLLVVLGAFLLKTALGAQIRAAAEDFDMARLLGVRADRVIATAFAISGILAAIAAFLLIARTGSLTPEIGVQPILFAFIATIIGGLGSLRGAVAGGLLLGVLTVILQVTLPIELRAYRDAFVFAVVLGILVFRPAGLIPVAAAKVRV